MALYTDMVRENSLAQDQINSLWTLSSLPHERPMQLQE
jgi:hypothetical protein